MSLIIYAASLSIITCALQKCIAQTNQRPILKRLRNQPPILVFHVRDREFERAPKIGCCADTIPHAQQQFAA